MSTKPKIGATTPANTRVPLRTTVGIDPALYPRLVAAAKVERRSAANLASYAIEQYLDRQEATR